MNIFISWSGEGTASYKVARGMAVWLEGLFQTSVNTFVSSEDIDKGKLWFSEIAGNLESTDFRIICVTPTNQIAPWLMFEAGAIAKKVSNSNVVPLLIGMAPHDLTGPLAQFQAARFEQGELKSLAETINSKLGD